MFVSGRQLFFLLGFGILVLVQLILGESYSKLFIFAAWMVFFLFHFSLLDWRCAKTYQLPIILWLIWIITLICTSFFSHSIPRSLSAILDQVFGLTVFIFFLTLKESFISKKIILSVLVVVSTIAVVLSSVFLFYPGWGSILPGMNLLYPSYGHNHLAAVLLLVLPLAWWLVIEQKKHYLLVLPLLISLGILLSFGRVAVLLGLLQTIFISIYIFWTKKKISRFISAAFVIFIVLLLIKLSIQSFFSVSSVLTSSQHCPFPKFENQLCKSISEEPRLLYWEQAWQATKEYPLTGYGPGTFGLISQKYRQTPQLKTLYTHNDYFQNFAEVGILGGITFIFLIFSSLYLVYRRIKHNLNQESYLLFIFVALVGIIINNFFDYDWHFSTTFGITLILFALGIKNYKASHKIASSLSSKLTQSLFVLMVGCIAILALLYSWNTYLIRNNKEAQAFALFPYFLNHLAKFQYSKSLDQGEQKKLADIYTYDTNFFMKQENLTSEQLELFLKIDPWLFMEIFKPDDILLEKATLYAQKMEAVLNKAKRSKYDDYLLANRVSNKLHTVAVLAFSLDEKEIAYNLYVIAASFDNWSVHFHPVPVDWYNPSSEDCSFLEKMSTLPLDPFGDQKEIFARGYVRCIAVHFSQMELAAVMSFSQRSTELAPWVQPEILSELERENPELLIEASNTDLHKKYKELVFFLE